MWFKLQVQVATTKLQVKESAITELKLLLLNLRFRFFECNFSHL